MRKSMMAVILTAVMTLVACQTDDTGMNGNNGDNQTNYEQTRYTGNQNDGMGNGNQNREGIANRQGNDPDKNERRGSGVNDNEFGDGSGQDNFEVSDELAERIANNVDEVERAHVMAGEENAYVAVMLENDNNNNNNNGNNNNRNGNGNGNNDVSDDVKEEITDIIQTNYTEIENVYVSANPDFFGTLSDYADRAADGDPIEGFFEETNQMLQRIFPDLHKNDSNNNR